MMIIHRPKITTDNNKVKLSAAYELDGIAQTLWFSTTSEFGEYLCHTRADAFLVGLLLTAMQRNHNIRVVAPVSARLYYTLANYMVPMLNHIQADLKPITITCTEIDDAEITHAGAVGTGVSCGIDSLYTIATHLREYVPPAYRLTHFTFFDVGSHGGTQEQSISLFNQRLAMVRPFAEECGIPLVTLQSNIGDISDMPFQSTFTCGNMAAILALQPLFKRYYYSSGTPVFDFNPSWEDACSYDLFSLQMLSAKHIEIFPSGTTAYRSEKTNIVADYAPSYRYLNVCISSAHNCSFCSKCLRTLLTLDILGKVDRYAAVFDLDIYYREKDKFIGLVLYSHSFNPFMQDVYMAMEQHGFRISATARAYRRYYSARAFFSKIEVLRRLYHAIRSRI